MMRWIKNLFRHGIIERQLDSELRFHLEQQVTEYVARGMTPEEAYRRAQVELGGIEQVRQKCRERRWENHVEGVVRDVRFAMRRLGKDPRFSITAILALGLGIGSTTVVFSVVYHLLFHPFTYRDYQRSIVFQIHDLSDAVNDGRAIFSLPEFLAFRQQNQVFEDVVGYNNAVNVSYNDGNGTREIFGTRGSESHAGAGGAYVTTNTFDYYGVSPLLGRGIVQEDGRSGAPPVFVMNYRLWQEVFHGDREILGKTLLLNGEPRTLVGIMPPRFQIYGSGVWLPLSLDLSSGETVRAIEGLHAIGRLKPGISLEAAAADLTSIAGGLSKIYPDKFPARFTVTTETLIDHLLRKFKSTLFSLLAAVFMLLLIACTNVATLLLARAATREGEIALRASLGASRSRLIRQLLIEAFVLAAAGCLLGCFLAYGALKWLEASIPAHMIPDGVVLQLSPAVLAFAAAVSIATTLLCGLAPSFHAVGRNLQAHLAGFGIGADTAASLGSLRTTLVIAEIALSIVLLSGASLMMRSFFALTHVDLGFHPYSVLYARLDLPKGRYEGAETRNSLLRRILQQVNTLPGVTAAAETWSLPPDDARSSDVNILGKVHSQEWDANTTLCSEGYFPTLGLPLLRGRLFSEGDVESARHVAVINQTLARRFFGNDNPIGQRIKFNQFDKLPNTPHDAYFEIIGVVADYRNAGLRKPPVPEALMPYTISPRLVPNILARTALNPSLLLKSVDQAVWAVDPQVGIDMSGSLGSILDEYEYEQPRFEFAILGAFSGIGLLLVIIGIYSVMAYMVTLRTHEIGVRMALGAQSGTIVQMVLKKGLGMIAIGILIGVLASLGLTRFLASQLWGVSITDPWTFALVTTCVLIVGLAACFFPARHAAQVDPLITLRYE
jgi:putative ABC transport system permease protein